MSSQPPLIEANVIVNGIEVPQTNVHMVRGSLDDIDALALESSLGPITTPHPENYRIRTYRPGDEDSWLEIIRSAERFFLVDDALFDREFGTHPSQLVDRMFILDWIPDHGSPQPIGTATAWWKDEWLLDAQANGPADAQANTQPDSQPINRGEWAQVHWVAIRPEHQGKGLSKPIMSAVMNRMAQSHQRAMLGTSTARIWAIKLYLDLGFAPDSEELKVPAIQAAWIQAQKVLKHPMLEATL